MFKGALLAAAAGLILSACGTVCACVGGPPVQTTPNPYYSVISTEKDHTATLRVGQRLELVLHAYPGMTNWSRVKSSDTLILGPVVNPAATAVRGVTLAAFQANTAGEADITATATPDCSPGHACPMLAAVYTLRVTVILTG